VDAYIAEHVWLAWLILPAAFMLLARSADLFVGSSVALARRFGIPKLVIGIVLVSFATTAPELSVSLMAALADRPEMALGNAVGSVICNAGLGLALAALLAPAAIPVLPLVLRTSGLFSLGIGALIFLFVMFDYSLSGWEGFVLLALYGGYMVRLYRMHRAGQMKEPLPAGVEAAVEHLPLLKTGVFFVLGLAGIIVASRFIVISATTIARSLGVPESIIALTLVALGTSIPEVATCVTASRKGHGAIAVGNIIGANILNICWVAGASSLANALTVSRREVFFMFPVMLVMMLAMLLLIRRGHDLRRSDGAVLLALYIGYLALTVVLFPPGQPVNG